jgi:Flp pilus assembly protein TadG
LIPAAWREREAGNAALEFVILAPPLLFIVGLIIALGFISNAQNSVSDAARDAARQASLQLNPGSASAAGYSTALAALTADGLHCSSLSVNVQPYGADGLHGFQVAVGQPAAVSATVTCTVPLAQIIVPGLPGSQTIEAHFASPLDLYRQR